MRLANCKLLLSSLILLGTTLILLGAGAPVYGQVGAPVLGFVPDGSRVRPVFGMAAAAFIAPQLATNRDLSQMAASPANNYVLASAADNGDVQGNPRCSR
jgi:hypothetical protein